MSTRTKAAVTDTLPALFPQLFPGHGEDTGLDLPPLTSAVEAQIGELLPSGRFDAWSEALARVGNCSKPVRLHGHSERIDTTTGEILTAYSSADEPLGVTHVRCATVGPQSARRARGCTPATCSS